MDAQHVPFPYFSKTSNGTSIQWNSSLTTVEPRFVVIEFFIMEPVPMALLLMMAEPIALVEAALSINVALPGGGFRVS